MTTELKFDRARFDAGEMPTRTRDGRRVLKVFDSGLDVEYPIVAWNEDYDGVCEYTREGLFLTGDYGRPHAFDLVHEPKTRKVRVVLVRSKYTPGKTVAYSGSEIGEVANLIARGRDEGRFIREIEVEVEA